ncbi:MAG: class I SAM-dependent methyltransferase [Candidatus Gracilibacteria bacterium]|nr:class I SAM-dependent methyltransferase [Candidatus Gracilibacteria bacterium]
MSYDSFAQTFSHSRTNLHWGEIDYLVDFMKGYFGSTTPALLDVGCGNGRLIETLDKSSFSGNYLGIDESIGMITEAQKLHGDKQFQVLDMENVDSLNQTFDAIVFIASFHHLDTETKRKEVLRKTANLLNPGGIIAMTNWHLLGPAFFPKYEKSYLGNGDFTIKIGAHSRYYHSFSIDELAGFFAQTGLSLIENRVTEGEKNILSIAKKTI